MADRIFLIGKVQHRSSLLLVGAAGVEPARLAAQEPKSCVYANFTTRPMHLDVSHHNKPLAQEQAATPLLQATVFFATLSGLGVNIAVGF